jgi:opacity protein-like surface antigen
MEIKPIKQLYFMKKKSLFIILFLCICWQMNAQIQKGTRTLGGSVGFSSTTATSTTTLTGYPTKESSSSSSYLSLAPKGGIMLTDNVMVGAEIDFSISGRGGQSSSTTTIGLLPFGRYYFPAGDKFYVFGEFALGFGSSSNGSASASVTTWHIGPGASYFIKDNIAIEAELNFNSTKYKDASQAINTTTLGIGLQFYF